MPDFRHRVSHEPHINRPSPAALDLRAKGWGKGSAQSQPGVDGPPVNYGNVPAFGNVLTIAASVQTTDAIWLPRPPNTRLFLFVRNIDLTGANNIIYLAFDQIASTAVNGGSLPLQPGDSFNFMDFVPQNDLHLVASAADTPALIWYFNVTL